MSEHAPIRIVYPHQLYPEQLNAQKQTRFVLVEDDLFFRQYAFHCQKLILHRVTLQRFTSRLRDAGFTVHEILTDADSPTLDRLTAVLKKLGPADVTVYDPTDDWLLRDCRRAVHRAGLSLTADDVLESPNFLTTREQITDWFGADDHKRGSSRMQHFYMWQRTRLDVLVDDGQPVGGRWSYDTENRKKLPKNHAVPDVAFPPRHRDVDDAIAWVKEEFPDAPGDPDAFCWPVTPEDARAMLRDFLDARLDEFGPYEDAVSGRAPWVFHGLLTPPLNIGLLSPREILDATLEHAEGNDIPIASLEGFIRQVIGWREYMRACYLVYGRRMRTRNALEHHRDLAPGWWTAETGLEPVDATIRKLLTYGWTHHIERLMVLGNAMCLLRIHPDEVYRWFSELFVDAYDWVMVPNVYAMSQYAAGDLITTKPYVSGSNYLKKMTDFPTGEWTKDWDALYWTFVRDHRDVFASNNRSSMMVRQYDAMDATRKTDLTRRARRWLD